MPIFIEIDGIKGTVRSDNQAGGGNFAFSDGSVKNIGRSNGNGGGPRVIVFDGTTQRLGSITRGHKFTLERHFDADGTVFNVSRISLPNSSAAAIDALAPNAVVKARDLFEAQRNTVTSLGVIFSISTSAANKLLHSNNLKQMAIASHGIVSTVRFFITDQSNQTGVTVELENCLITNYTLSEHGGANAGELFKLSFVG